ncbi:MAG: anti-sigma factor family protein [Actinomycetota bacterium]
MIVRQMSCGEIREMLPAYAGENEYSLELRRHLARCADCRVEFERYRSLVGDLGELAARPVDPPAYLVASLKAIPETDRSRVAALRKHVARNRSAYAGGAAVAVLGAGAAIWRARRTATA